MKFEEYQSRRIEIVDVLSISGWNVKVYTITNNKNFSSKAQLTLNEAILSIPNWLEEVSFSTLPIYNSAFLIVHEAREGVWILLNWWTGGEMIETKTFFAETDQPLLIKNTPHKNSLLCVWELEVFAFERKSWIKHVLSEACSPDFVGYTNDHLIQTQ